MFIYPLTNHQDPAKFPVITQRFGNPTSYGTHEGIDWAAYTGQPIYAAADGIVTNAIRYDLSGAYHPYGIYLWVDHQNGYWTAYCHLERIIVKAGDTVKRGQLIAYADNTGNSTGSHLHFNVTLNKVYVDPLPLMDNELPNQNTPPISDTTVKVIADAGLRVRRSPSASGVTVTTLADNSMVYATKETVTTSDGYRWIRLASPQVYKGIQIGDCWIALDRTPPPEVFAVVQL